MTEHDKDVDISGSEKKDDDKTAGTNLMSGTQEHVGRPGYPHDEQAGTDIHQNTTAGTVIYNEGNPQQVASENKQPVPNPPSSIVI